MIAITASALFAGGAVIWGRFHAIDFLESLRKILRYVVRISTFPIDTTPLSPLHTKL